MPDEFSPSLEDLARRSTGVQQWQQAIEQNRQRGTTVPQRLSGLASGLGQVANMAWEGSLPAQLRNMYQALQQGAAPEDLAGQSFNAAMRMLDYGVAMPGTAIPRGALGSLRLRRTWQSDNDALGHYHRKFAMHNEAGQPVGEIYFTYNARTNELHVNSMMSNKTSPLGEGSTGKQLNPRAWSLGPAELQSLAPEIRREFPFAKTLVFERASGAISKDKEVAPVLRRRLPWADEDQT
jgi:hypothetical protein